MARRRQFQTAQRRRTGWEVGVGDIDAILTVTAPSVSIIGDGVILASDGFTLIRTRGIIQLITTSNDIALGGFTGAFGICKVTRDAFDVGVTAVPDPVADSTWDGWLWHTFFSLLQGSVFSAQVSAGSGNMQIVIDSKAMRKAAENEVFILVGEFLESGVASMSVVADTRMLFKLP